MRHLDAFLTRVMTRARNCPDPVMLDGVRTAAIIFCERTKLWRESDKFKATGSCSEIVCAPYGAVLHKIESARFEGDELEPVSLSWLDDNIPHWRDAEGTNSRYMTQVSPNTVRLVPAAPGQLAITMILKPSEDAEQVPAFLYDLYARVIADGALAEIFSIPGQPYSDAGLAQYHAARFDAELNRLASAGARGQQRAPVRITPQFF